MNRSQLLKAIHEELATSSDEWKLSDVKDVFTAFETVVTNTVGSGDPVTISGFCKFARKDTPAKPSRQGRNPATGETITLKPKPASVTVKLTPLKAFKDAVIAAAAPKPAKSKKKGKKKKK